MRQSEVLLAKLIKSKLARIVNRWSNQAQITNKCYLTNQDVAELTDISDALDILIKNNKGQHKEKRHETDSII